MQRIFLVGAGVIARAHATAAHLLNDEIELHVVDTNSSAIASFVTEFPDAVVHDSVNSLLSSESDYSDIVVVATPPATHAELAVKAFSSGRHVLSEKPLAVSMEQAEMMLAAARQADRHLGDCSMRFLGYRAEEQLRAALREGRLGQVYQVTCRHRVERGRSGIEYQPTSRWFLDRSKSGGGVQMDWSVYDIAALFHLLEPERVVIHHAWNARPITSTDPTDSIFDVETHVGASMSLLWNGRRPVTLNYERASATHGTDDARIEVEGTEGAVIWKWLPYLDKSTGLRFRSDQSGTLREYPEHFPNEAATHLHHRPLHFFRDYVLNRPTPVIADTTALFNFAIIQGLYAAAVTGEKVTVEREQFEKR